MKIIYVYGIVQGVGFRPTVFRVAKQLGCKGYVRNTGNCVEICVDRRHDKFIATLKRELPPLAKIENIVIKDLPGIRPPTNFSILPSTGGARETVIPPDTALCAQCVAELFDKKNRMFGYQFINCTDCGARFSVTFNTPYDRKNTAMKSFKLCEECKREYLEPLDRRFHHQTISCPKDGPTFQLYDGTGKRVFAKEPIREFASLIRLWENRRSQRLGRDAHTLLSL